MLKDLLSKLGMFLDGQMLLDEAFNKGFITRSEYYEEIENLTLITLRFTGEQLRNIIHN